jgi:glycerophosphoryl diester phosphodiesterase
MAWALFRIFAGWIIALPMLLLKRVSPLEALRSSRELATPMRKPVAVMLLLWASLSAVLFGVLGGILDLGVWAAEAIAGNSLHTMAYLTGGLMVLWSLANLALSFFSNCVLSLGILSLFGKLFPDPEDKRLNSSLSARSTGHSLKIPGTMMGVLIVILLVVAGFVLKVTVNRLELDDRTAIIAHRGASSDGPENTLAAMELAIEQGADWVEIDVQETREGEIVVIHDRDLMKVGASPLRVFDSPLADLQNVDIGSWIDPQFSDQRVPTLKELLMFCKGRVKVNIELKYYGREKHFEELVVAIVEETGMQDEIELMSLSLPGVRKMKALRPRWRVGLLSSFAIGDVTRLDVDFFAINARFASRAFVRNAHNRGRMVYSWTVNDPVQMSAMMGKRVDGIITDKPGLATHVRAQRADLDLHERFLIQFASLFSRRVGPEQ